MKEYNRVIYLPVRKQTWHDVPTWKWYTLGIVYAFVGVCSTIAAIHPQ